MTENSILGLRSRIELLLERKRHLLTMLDEVQTQINDCKNRYGTLMISKIESERSFATSEGLTPTTSPEDNQSPPKFLEQKSLEERQEEYWEDKIIETLERFIAKNKRH